MREKSSEIRKEKTEGMQEALSYRWVIWGVMVFAFMVSIFHRFAAGVVKDDVTSAFSLSSGAFGSMASMYFYAYTIMQIPVGYLADTLGVRITISVGMFAAGIGSILFGFAPTAFWLFAGRFLVGLGVSTVFVCIMKIQSQWFRNREFATLSGATTLVGSAGGILSQGPLALLLAYISWRSGFIAIGVLTLGISLLCWCFVRNRPQDMGFPPINEREIFKADMPKDHFSLLQGLKEILPIKGMLPVAIFYLFNQGGMYALMGTWAIPWLVAVYGLTIKEASSYSVILVIGSMVGGFLTGWISDRIGRRKSPMILWSLLHVGLWGVIVFSSGGVPPLEWIRSLFFLLGITSTSFVLAWSVAKEITPVKYTALAISVLNAAGFLTIALSTSVIGGIIDSFSSLPLPEAYSRAFLLPFGTAILSATASFFVPETGMQKTSGRVE